MCNNLEYILLMVCLYILSGYDMHDVVEAECSCSDLFNYCELVLTVLCHRPRNCDHILDYPRAQSFLLCSSLYFSFEESNVKEKELQIFEYERIRAIQRRYG